MIPADRPPPDCSACPRLVALRARIRSEHPDYHAAPVPPWGPVRARMLIVGLAPGMHGANRTGRPFTGDASGDFLFQALYRVGFASAPTAQEARLRGVRITNAVKCLPPGNRPTAEEIRNCSRYLAAELRALCGVRPIRPRVILCLGRIAHQAVTAQLGSTVQPFRHGAHTVVRKNVHVLDTYHPSRQNTQTGRLTSAMLDRVLELARAVLDA